MNEQEQMAKALAEAVEKKVAQEMRNLQQELVAQKEASLPVKKMTVGQYASIAADAFLNRITQIDAAKKRGVSKSFEAGDAISAGLLVDQDVAAGFIGALVPEISVMNAGAKIVRMPRGNLKFKRRGAASGAAYGGECPQIPQVYANGDTVTMIAKKLTGLAVVCKDLIEYGQSDVAEYSADAYIEGLLIESISQKADQALLMGLGINDAPLGLFGMADVSNISYRTLSPANTGSITVETVKRDLNRLLSLVAAKNVKMKKPVWFIHSDVKYFLQSFVTGIGEDLALAKELENGMLLGIPVMISNNLPRNLLGSSIGVNVADIALTDSDWSPLILADMSSIVIGIGRDLTIDSTDQGAVSTACGIQGFGTDDVIVRGITSHDIMAEQDGKEIAILWNNWNLYA